MREIGSDPAWTFGGPLAGVPADAAWTLLAVAAGLVGVISWISYRTAVAKLGLFTCLVLAGLRMLTLMGLLLCLANPVRIETRERQPPPPAPPPPPRPPGRLVVVVDRSDSMTQPDNRGRSRLDDALATWRRLEKTAQGFFAPATYYSFAADLRPAASLEEAVASRGETGETKLYASVAELLDLPIEERPEAIVVLTDGVDTTSDEETLLQDRAVAAGIPLYFVAGINRSARPEPFVRVRELRTPPTVMQNTEFTVESVFEAFSRADRTVSFSLWQNERAVASGNLRLTMGSNVIDWVFRAAAREPGFLDFAILQGHSPDSPVVARSVTRVLAPADETTRVLIYQGALDWGLRFLDEALRTDPSFRLATLVNPDSGMAVARSDDPNKPVLGTLPTDPRALAGFNCVVLTHLSPLRLSAEQQEVLVDFTRRGGSILFVNPDAKSVSAFADGPLNELLPVGFSPTGSVAPVAAPKNAPLERLALTEAGQASPIFAQVGAEPGSFLQPRFAEFVPVARVKPGAEVLAVHPHSRDPETGQPHVLLATMNFGRGRSALLTTDSLWRWKLSEPSELRVVETFWQQLILALRRREEPDMLRFVKAPGQVMHGETVLLPLAGPAEDPPPVVLAGLSGGKVATLEVRPTPDAETPWTVVWTASDVGAWEIGASREHAHPAFYFPAVLPIVTGELAKADPALETMQAIAGSTGGMLLRQEPPSAWLLEEPGAPSEKPLEAVTQEHAVLLWNHKYVLAFILGIYALELLGRRLARLL